MAAHADNDDAIDGGVGCCLRGSTCDGLSCRWMPGSGRRRRVSRTPWFPWCSGNSRTGWSERYRSSGKLCPCSRLSGGAQVAEDFTGHEPFQATYNLLLRLAFCGAPTDIVEGRPMAAHADNDDAIDGSVGLSVASAVQPASMAGTSFLSRGCSLTRRA